MDMDKGKNTIYQNNEMRLKQFMTQHYPAANRRHRPAN